MPLGCVEIDFVPCHTRHLIETLSRKHEHLHEASIGIVHLFGSTPNGLKFVIVQWAVARNGDFRAHGLVNWRDFDDVAAYAPIKERGQIAVKERGHVWAIVRIHFVKQRAHLALRDRLHRPLIPSCWVLRQDALCLSDAAVAFALLMLFYILLDDGLVGIAPCRGFGFAVPLLFQRGIASPIHLSAGVTGFLAGVLQRDGWILPNRVHTAIFHAFNAIHEDPGAGIVARNPQRQPPHLSIKVFVPARLGRLDALDSLVCKFLSLHAKIS